MQTLICSIVFNNQSLEGRRKRMYSSTLPKQWEDKSVSTVKGRASHALPGVCAGKSGSRGRGVISTAMLYLECVLVEDGV